MPKASRSYRITIAHDDGETWEFRLTQRHMDDISRALRLYLGAPRFLAARFNWSHKRKAR